MNWFTNNREIIKGLAINTGTTLSPTYTEICTTSEVSVSTELETKDFYVFCDALQRKIITGANVTLSGILKIDMNNAGDVELLGKIHTLIGSGEVSQFARVEIQFDLLTDVSGSTLTYTTYQAVASLSLSDLGGAAEDEGEMSFELQLIGTATVVASS